MTLNDIIDLNLLNRFLTNLRSLFATKSEVAAYTPTLSQNYVPSNLLNEGLVIEEGDTHEEAIAKIHKTILDNEEISVRAITDLDTQINYINSHVPKSTSVTQIVSINQSEYNALASKDSSTLYIITSS